MKNSIKINGNRTRDLPTWSAVPGPTVPTRAHFGIVMHIFVCKFKEFAALKGRKNFIQFQQSMDD
jgi:hypothetical protein